MLALVADENFNNDIVRGLLRRKPDLNIVHVQDVGLSGADDPTVLEWASRQRRVIFTHDASTMTHHAYERVRSGQSTLGRSAAQIPSVPGFSRSR
jgi:predicted nuclease of predicted toxin-antitoxin system